MNLLLYPAHTLPTAAAPVIVGVGLAIHNGVFSPLPALAGFFASWLIHVAGVFTDNYELLTRHAAIPEHPELTEGVRNGSLPLRVLLTAILTCFALAALSSPYLLETAGIAVLLFGAVGVLASLGYSLGPFSETRLGLADPTFFGMFGVVAIAGTYYVQAAHLYLAPFSWSIALQALPPAVLVVGLPVGAIVTNVLLIDDLRDREFDALKRWRTGAVRFGVRWTRAEFTVLMIFAYLMPLALRLAMGYSLWILLPLITLPRAIAVTRIVCTEDARDRLVPMTPRTAMLALEYAILLAAGLALPG